jgi:hypothetical protein
MGSELLNEIELIIYNSFNINFISILVVNFDRFLSIILSYKMGSELLPEKLGREILKKWVVNY